MNTIPPEAPEKVATRGYVRRIMFIAAFVAFLAGAIVQYQGQRDDAIRECQDVRATRVQLIAFLEEASEARQKDGHPNVARSYRLRADKVRSVTPGLGRESCKDRYSSHVPFIE